LGLIFAASQRGAGASPIHPGKQAEIKPDEPGQIMLPREVA